MKLFILFTIFVITVRIQGKNNLADNEFAEFEVPDESISETDDNFVKITEIKEKKEEVLLEVILI